MRWMNLEPIVQNEVSQKEKDKYHTLTHIYGIQKDGTDEFICRAAMEKQTNGHGEGRNGRMKFMERVTWKLTIPYVKQITIGNYYMIQGTPAGAL